MKLYKIIIAMIIIAIGLNVFNYDYFVKYLSVVWYLASVLIIYSSLKYSYKFKFIQLRVDKIIKALCSKSKSGIKPIESLCVSLAAKIGVGSLSGVALCLYFGGVGAIFWLGVVSLLVSINTYLECLLGNKYREKSDEGFIGGPSYYILKCLKDKKLAILYSVLIIITYSGFFLSIQVNTIVSTVSFFEINKTLIMVVLAIGTLIIIRVGLKGISLVNSILVPVMLLIYLVVSMYVIVNNYGNIFGILKDIIKEAFNFRNFILVFLIGMQRAIFITESSIGTSAISASSCDNDPKMQGLLEVLGIHIVTFLISFSTFFIIVTSNYREFNYDKLNGIEIVMEAFNYHFGANGRLILAIITVLFAFSTIISSYFFGDSNLPLLSKNKVIKVGFKIFFIGVIVVSCYVKPSILWNLCDFFIALLAIINVLSLIRIMKMNKI